MHIVGASATVLVALLLTACDDPPPDVADVAAETTVPPPTVPNVEPSVATTSLVSAPATSTDAAPSSSVPEVPDPRMYRPEPIRTGGEVTATLWSASESPVDAVDASMVTISLVDFPDGRFLQVDLADVEVPDGAAFWTVTVNGRLKMKATATAGSTLGARVDRNVYGDTFVVAFNAIGADEAVIASTGDIELTDVEPMASPPPSNRAGRS